MSTKHLSRYASTVVMLLSLALTPGAQAESSVQDQPQQSLSDQAGQVASQLGQAVQQLPGDLAAAAGQQAQDLSAAAGQAWEAVQQSGPVQAIESSDAVKETVSTAKDFVWAVCCEKPYDPGQWYDANGNPVPPPPPMKNVGPEVYDPRLQQVPPLPDGYEWDANGNVVPTAKNVATVQNYDRAVDDVQAAQGHQVADQAAAAGGQLHNFGSQEMAMVTSVVAIPHCPSQLPSGPCSDMQQALQQLTQQAQQLMQGQGQVDSSYATADSPSWAITALQQFMNQWNIQFYRTWAGRGASRPPTCRVCRTRCGATRC